MLPELYVTEFNCSHPKRGRDK
jgi:hypothetical protein